MHSMTGFGRSEAATRFGKFVIEISSVNNRFLDLYVRLPKQLSILELSVKELVGKFVQRGKLSVFVGFEESEEAVAEFSINMAVAHRYHSQLKQLKKTLKLPGEITITELLAMPDIARPAKDRLNIDAAWKAMQPPLRKALESLVAMRKTEGGSMARVMSKRLTAMSFLNKKIKSRSKSSVKDYRDRLSRRIEELMDPSSRSNLRLEEEVAYFADRADIAEECTRLESHIEQYRGALKLKEPVGKKLNFILQEMNREANTIGSKCSDVDVAALVISLKEEIERLRELVQNVE